MGEGPYAWLGDVEADWGIVGADGLLAAVMQVGWVTGRKKGRVRHHAG